MPIKIKIFGKKTGHLELVQPMMAARQTMDTEVSKARKENKPVAVYFNKKPITDSSQIDSAQGELNIVPTVSGG